jgi:hypothetical protein
VKIPERFAVGGQHAGSIPGFFCLLGHGYRTISEPSSNVSKEDPISMG